MVPTTADPATSIGDDKAASSVEASPALVKEVGNGDAHNPQMRADSPVDKPLSTGLTMEAPSGTTRRPSEEPQRSSSPQTSVDIAPQTPLVLREDLIASVISSAELPSFKTAEEYEIQLKQLHSDYETSELQRQQETHTFIERIDALQAKLQYLSKESADAARKAASDAPAASAEKKLAEKDEQIALLMQEGQALSKTELKHMNTIKKLRAKMNEDLKDLADVKKKQEKAEKELSILTVRAKAADAIEKRLSEKQRVATQLQKEIESVKAQKAISDSKASNLRAQLEEATSQVKQTEVQVAHEALIESERKRASALEDDVSNLRIEKELAIERMQVQIKELEAKAERQAERARVAEQESLKEQLALESKLEVLRTRAEEVSSGATGDAQAKLLRQIETLQTQYAVASENWQGIEASLVSRIAGLEMERDEIAKREVDMRRKAREVVS